MGQYRAVDSYAAFLKLLRDVMAERGIKQGWLAEKMGMSGPWMSRVLSGDIEISVKQLVQIAEHLEVAPATLLPMIPVTQLKEGRVLTLEEFVRVIVREEMGKEPAK